MDKIWYPFDEAECSGNFPKNVFLDARIVTAKYTYFTLTSVYREDTIIRFIFNHLLEFQTNIKKQDRFVRWVFDGGYAIFRLYNTDIQSYPNLSLPILPTLICNLKGNIVSKVNVYYVQNIDENGNVMYNHVTFVSPFELKAGYNCHLYYNKETGKIYLSAIKNAGQGNVPDDYYEDHVSCSQGITRINGNTLEDGKLYLIGENGVEINVENNKIVIELKDSAIATDGSI